MQISTVNVRSSVTDDFWTEMTSLTSVHGCTGALWQLGSARSWRWALEDSDTETESSPLGRMAGN